MPTETRKPSQLIRDGIAIVPSKAKGNYFEFNNHHVACAACVNGTMAAAVIGSIEALNTSINPSAFIPPYITLNDAPHDLSEAAKTLLLNLKINDAYDSLDPSEWDASVHFVGVVLNDYTDMTKEEIADLFEACGI